MALGQQVLEQLSGLARTRGQKRRDRKAKAEAEAARRRARRNSRIATAGTIAGAVAGAAATGGSPAGASFGASIGGAAAPALFGDDAEINQQQAIQLGLAGLSFSEQANARNAAQAKRDRLTTALDMKVGPSETPEEIGFGPNEITSEDKRNAIISSIADINPSQAAALALAAPTRETQFFDLSVGPVVKESALTIDQARALKKTTPGSRITKTSTTRLSGGGGANAPHQVTFQTTEGEKRETFATFGGAQKRSDALFAENPGSKPQVHSLNFQPRGEGAEKNIDPNKILKLNQTEFDSLKFTYKRLGKQDIFDLFANGSITLEQLQKVGAVDPVEIKKDHRASLARLGRNKSQPKEVQDAAKAELKFLKDQDKATAKTAIATAKARTEKIKALGGLPKVTRDARAALTLAKTPEEKKRIEDAYFEITGLRL